MKAHALGIALLLLAFTLSNDGMAAHALDAPTSAAEEAEKRPEAPTSLSKASKLIPEDYIPGLDGNGDLYCAHMKRISLKLSAGASTLAPQIEARAKQEVQLAKVVCDKDDKFIGFPNTGTRNEKFVTDFYTITHALSRASGLIETVVPSFESQEGRREMLSSIKQLDRSFLLKDGAYKKALEEAYDKMSDRERTPSSSCGTDPGEGSSEVSWENSSCMD